MNKNQQLAAKLAEKIQKKGISQAEAARQIGVSSATISNALAGKWDGISVSGAWTKIALWAGEDEWRTASTANFLMIQDLCEDAQRLGQSRAISYKPGSGKSHAVKYYASNHPECFYVNCESSMSKPRLLKALCKTMGLQDSWNMDEMLDSIVEKIQGMEKPLLVLDEFDELSEKALRIFKDLYNRTRCGFVLVGGIGLQKRIGTGAKNAKQSYQEILSRLGGEFIGLKENNIQTVRKVCQVNGLEDEAQIEAIYKQSNGDLRTVKAHLEALKTKNDGSN